MWGALTHDIGKPITTVTSDGRIRSPGHDEEGVPISDALLGNLRASKELTTQVGALVRYHLAPALLPGQGAKPKAYRRLARNLAAAGVSFELLYRLALADHLGRTTADAVARIFPAGDEFLRCVAVLTATEVVAQDVVLGRHLLAKGMEPGPEIGRWLTACREVQDETGWTDVDRILDRVLAEGDAIIPQPKQMSPR